MYWSKEVRQIKLGGKISSSFTADTDWINHLQYPTVSVGILLFVESASADFLHPVDPPLYGAPPTRFRLQLTDEPPRTKSSQPATVDTETHPWPCMGPIQLLDCEMRESKCNGSIMIAFMLSGVATQQCVWIFRNSIPHLPHALVSHRSFKWYNFEPGETDENE